MAFPFLNSAESTGRIAPAGRAVLRSLPRAPARPMRRMLFEPLEPRVLLSAEDVVSGVIASMQNGFDALYDELADLLADDPLFQNYVPGFLTTLVRGDDVAVVSPTLAQALEISVDVYPSLQNESGFGEGLAGSSGALGGFSNSLVDRFTFIAEYIPTFFGALPASFKAEFALDAMDINTDGTVSMAEAFGVLVLGQFQYWADETNFIDAEDFADDFDGVLDLAMGVPAFLSSQFELDFDAASATPGDDILFNLANFELVMKQLQQVDIGYLADELRIGFDPAEPPAGNDPYSPGIPTERLVERTLSMGSLVIGFTGGLNATPGDPLALEDFYFATPAGLDIGLDMDSTVNGMDVNVGFLGTTVTDGDGFFLAMHVDGFAVDPSNAEPLGFTGSPVVSASGSITLPQAPATFDLDHDVQFSLKIGALSDSAFREVTVTDAATDGNTTLAELIVDVQAAVDGAFGAGLITVSDDGGKLSFSLPAVDPGVAGFPNQLSGSDAIEASSVSSYVKQQNTFFDVPDFQFLLAVDGELPKLVMVDGFDATLVDPDDMVVGDEYYEVTTADLIGAIQVALDAAFGEANFVIAGNNGDKIFLQRIGSTLEITRTLSFDTVEKITAAEIGADGTIFDLEPAAGNAFEVDLELTAKPGIEKPDDSDYLPVGTINVMLDPFDQAPGGTLDDGYAIQPIVVDKVPTTGEDVIKAKYELVFGGQMDPEMLDFNVLGPAEMVGIINQVAVWLERAVGTELFTAFQLPFTQGTLADILNFGDMVRDTLLIDDGDDGVAAPGASNEDINDKQRLLRWVAVGGDAQLLPMFTNAQQFEARLAEIVLVILAERGFDIFGFVDNIIRDFVLALIDATYDVDTKELTFNIDTDHNLDDPYVATPILQPQHEPDGVSVPLDFLLDLDPLGEFITDSTLHLSGEGRLQFTLGIVLGDAASPLGLDSLLLTDLNDGRGVQVNTNLALSSLADIDPIVGRLSSTAVLTVTWIPMAGADPEQATAFITRTATADNTTFADLLGDINDALKAAGVTDDGTPTGNLLIEAVDSWAGTGDRDTGRIVLQPTLAGAAIAAFQVSASSGNAASFELGLQPQGASTAFLVAPQSMAGPAPGVPVEFDVVIQRGGTTEAAVSVTVRTTPDEGVNESGTNNNSTLTDLVNDVNAALAAAGLADDIIAARSGSHLVLYAINAEVRGFSITPQANATDKLGLDATLAADRLDFRGVDETQVANVLSAGVLLRAQDPIANPFGRLASDLDFEINGVQVPLAAAATATNTSILDLVRDLNEVLNGINDLKGKIVADHDGFHLVFRALDPSIAGITVDELNNAEERQLGFQDAAAAESALRVIANRLAPVSFGVTAPTTFDIHVSDPVNGDLDWTATLGDAVTVTNRNLFDLAADINQAMNAGFIAQYWPLDNTVTAADNPLIAVVQGDRIVIGLKTQKGGSALVSDPSDAASEVTGFTITSPGNSTLATEIGLVGEGIGNQSNDADFADFLIHFSDGSYARVSLDGLVDSANPDDALRFKLDDTKTLQDLINHVLAEPRYNAAGTLVGTAGDKLAIGLRSDGSGLVLEETGFVADPNDPDAFRVVAVNGSPAAIQLGILASDTTQLDVGQYDAAAAGNPDGVIFGARLATLDIVDRVFLENPALSAALELRTDGEAFAEGTFGFVGISLQLGDDELLWQADVDVPFLTTGGRVNLNELFSSLNSISNLWQLVDLPVVTGGDDVSFDMAVSVWPQSDIVDDLFMLPAGAKITFDLTSFGALEKYASVMSGPDDSVRLAATDPEDPTDNIVDVTPVDIGLLANFETLRLDDVLDALETFADFLAEFADFGFLAQEIPLLGESINELLDVANRFAEAVETVRLNPAGGLQALAQALRQGFGIPEFANDAERDAYFLARGIPDPTRLIAFDLEDLNGTDDLMRFDLRVPVSLVQSRSVDLDLGEVDFLGGSEFVDLQGGAGLSVLGYLDTRLSFGVDLNSPGDVYLFNDATALFGAIKAKADNLVFNAAIGPMGVFIRDGSAEINVSFGMDNGSFDPNSDSHILVGDVTTLVAGDGGAEYGPNFLGEIMATLPVFFPDDSTYLGDIVLDISQANGNALELTSPTFTPPDLTDPNTLSLPDFSFIDLSQLNPFDSIPLLLDALDFFLQGLQDILDGEVFGIQLPLLGDQLSAGADFIENMRHDVLEPIRQFVEQAPETGEELIEKLLEALLGNLSSDDIFIGAQNLTDFLGLENPFQGLGLLQGPVTTLPDPDSEGHIWQLALGETYTPPVEIGFDLGFPALGLAMDAGLDISITWSLALGLGISRAEGAFVLVGGHPNPNPDTELLVTVDVGLPPGAIIDGRLGFLQLIIEERTSVANPDGTFFHAEFGVDVFNSQDVLDQKLSFSELGFLDVDVDLSAEAKVDLWLKAQFNEQIVPNTIAALLPKIQAGFLLDWSTGDITADDFDFADSLKFVGFDDVRLDMGSFLTEFLGPFVNKVAEVTGPVQPVIDVFTTRLPGISDLAGRTITLLDIAGLFGDVDTGMIYAIADIITLVNQIGAISDGTELLVPLGDFMLFDKNNPVAGFEDFAQNLALPTFNLGASGDDSDFDFDAFVAATGQQVTDFANKLNDTPNDGQGAKALSQSLVNKTAPGAGDFSFPLFDNPSLAFGLLLNRDVPLVEYDLPPFGVDFTYVQKFPIWGPLFARITGSVGLTIDLAFGYDTFGPRKFAQGNFSNPLDLIAGFYVNDTDQPGGTGTDVPELILRGELFAGAEINLGIATAGVEGGVILTFNFDLYDPDRDGKVRIDELVGNFLYEFEYGNAALAPIAIFDVFGDVAVQLRAFIEFLFFEKTFDITPPITLFEFSIEFDREPILATARGDGALVLNIGGNAAARLNGDTRDIGEEIFVKSVSANEVLVWSPKFNVDESAAQSYYIGGDNPTVIVYGGDGDDVINLMGLGHGLKFFVDAGAGDDTVIGGSAGGEIFGGLGDDMLTGGEGNDLIVGGLGNDVIDGGPGDDWLFGDNGKVTAFELEGVPMYRFRALPTLDDGDDVIHGGEGNDIAFGGGGYDMIFGDAGHDLLIGDGGYFEGPVAAGGIPMSNGVVDITRIIARGLGADDRVWGGAGNDTILGGPGNDLLDGGSDNDLVSGGAGDDTVYGGTGADWLFGDDGHDLVFGYRDPFAPDGFDLDPGDVANADPNADLGDYIEGGDGNDFVRGQLGDDIIHGNRGADIIFGDEGDDTIGAAFLARPWVADPDDQLYNTEAGGDIIFGGADDDTVNAGTGGDLVFGDDGLVVYLNFPDTTGLLAAHQLGSRIRTDAGGDHKLIGDGDETTLIKAADLAREDGLGTTPDLYATEPLATDGDDYIAGGDGNDIAFGGGGDDEIYGDFDPTAPLFGPRPTGQDVLIGDGGRVELFGRRYQAIEAVANADYDGEDEISGNDGGDYIFGGGNEDLVFGFENPAQGSNLPLESLSENDSIFGDNGRIEFDPSDRFNRITRMFTTFAGADESGASDEIWGQWGADVIFGGLNSSNDVLSGGLGNDIVIGDQGEVLFYAPGLGAAWEVFPEDDFPTFDPNFAGREFWDESFPLFLVRSYRDNIGGSDIVSGNQGDDILIGGTAGDFMYGDDPTGSTGAADGEDIMLGDNGEVWFNIDFEEPDFDGDDPVPPPNTSIGRLVAQVAAMPYASAIDRINTSDLAENTGGADFMSGNAGADILFGGVNDGGVDRLFGDREAPDAATLALDADDILVGDNGVVDFAFDGDADRTTLDLIRSFEDALGGTDIISGDAGHDVGIGGTGGDVIFGDRAEPDADSLAADGDDLLIGDNADIFLVAAPDPLPLVPGDLKLVLDAAVFVVRSTDEDYDATVPANNTGGVDTIAGNAGDDVILGGVEGDYLYGDGVAVSFQDPENDDWTILSRTAVRSEADGADIILGDNGALEWLSAGRFGEVMGIDIGAQNPALFAHFDGGTDDDVTTLDLVTTEQPNNGGRDWIWGGDANDALFGGTDADTMFGDNGFAAQGMGGIGDGLPESSGDGDGDDLMFGDHGRLYPQFSLLRIGPEWRDFGHSRNFFAIDSGELDGGEGDRMWGQGGADNLLGQQGDDRMWGGDDDDDMTGGHNVSGGWDELGAAGAIEASITNNAETQDFNDLMDGGEGDDVMAGDNAIIWRRDAGDAFDPRFRALTEDAIYATTPTEIHTNVAAEGSDNPNGTAGRDIELLDHDFTVQGDPPGRYGRDIMAGGAHEDRMFGQLGDDLMQGDGEIELDPAGAPYLHWQVDAPGLAPDPDPYDMLHFNIPERSSDGDDYLEGNGGADLMFGGLGQDDMIGGSSELYGLDAWAKRPDGSDILFGGAGIRTERNDFGGDINGIAFAEQDGVTDAITTLEGGHARDADYMMGDNANIFRLVDGDTGAFLEFNYDAQFYAGDQRIIPRAMMQLDYHLGGADYHGGSYVDGQAHVTGADPDNGAADFMHGEAGDDVMFGMTGSDLMFGGAQDDDMVGGYGHDWASGGTGRDGIIGDDGLVFTSRNSAAYGEPLYGIAPLLANDPEPKYSGGNVLDEVISTPGNIQQAKIHVADELKKSVDLTPFSYDPDWVGMDDEYPDNDDPTPFADDIIFGGLGSDWLHGGSGDDAMSGAEALTSAWVPDYVGGVLDLGYHAVGLPDGPWVFLDVPTYGNVNPGNVLGFNPVDEDGWQTQNRLRAGEFALYDEYDPLRKIMLTPAGALDQDGGGLEFLLNFDPDEGVLRPGDTVGKKNQPITYPDVRDDGADVMFGDTGNDWAVGGTGRDRMYGGWGNDLLNADDHHETNGALNDEPDTHPTYEDIAYGGAGRDVLIANTGGDRLIDWVGEYNSYLVPFAPFGMATVSRTVQPFLPEYLYALSLGDGIDASRPDDTGGDPERNAEPFGELGLVLQKDFAWQAQTGAPADPQAGNIPGGKRDVLRSADFSGDEPQGFMVDSGQWSLQSGRYQVEPATLGGSALSVWHHDQYQPNYFEVLATVNVVKPIKGYKANAYIVFDYQSEDDFKFAGLNGSTNKIEIGHKQGNTWTVLTSINLNVKHSTDYNMLLSVNGTSVILVVDNQHMVSHTFAPRTDADGILYNINAGMIGLGADNGRAAIGNMHLLVLPPQITHSASDDFSTAPALLGPLEGDWTLADGRLAGQPEPGGQLALASGDLQVAPSAVLQLETTFSTAATGGIVFDQYATNDFKWAAWSKATNQVQIGYYTARDGWVVSQSVSMNLDGDVDFKVTLKGTTVSVLVNDAPAVSHAFNAIVTDGHFGLFARGGDASFDHFTVMTDDPSFAPPASHELTAAFAGSGENAAALDAASLDAISQAAINRWAFILGETPALFYGLEFTIADLGGLALARIEGNVVTVDENAAGHGWFIDPTPYEDGEFRVPTADGLRATPSSEAYGRMDLLTVLMHELGHAIGYHHDSAVPGATALMTGDLVPGLRAVDFVPPGQKAGSGDSQGDLYPAAGDPQPVLNGKRGTAPAGGWTWDADRGAFVQDAAGWQTGRLFSYLSLGTAMQADDWLTSESAGDTSEPAAEDWLEFAPAPQVGDEGSLIEWAGL